jgi:hypothetical protein
MLARPRATLWFTVGNGCPLLIPIVCASWRCEADTGEVRHAVTSKSTRTSRQIGRSSSRDQDLTETVSEIHVRTLATAP